MLMFNLFSKSKNLITPILRCQLCSLDSQYKATICKDCWTQIPWETEKIIKQEVPIFVACRYEYPINRIIQKFKYEQQLHFQHLLANLILQLHLPKVQAIVPMPISEERLIERGYNQSLEVAKIVAKILNIPIWQPIQRMHQHSQKGLTRLERIENIQSQFQIKKDLLRRQAIYGLRQTFQTIRNNDESLLYELQKVAISKEYSGIGKEVLEKEIEKAKKEIEN